MDENQKISSPVHLVELGPLTLECLRKLSAALERSVPTSDDACEPVALPRLRTMSQPEKPTPFLNANEAAAYLGTTVSSLYGLVERRQIEPLRGPRRRYRFTKEMLNQYLKRGSRS